jgi:hypothetical protein
MYFVLSDRDVLLSCLPKRSVIVELGVFKGDHAEEMLRVVDPKELHLVDAWHYDLGEHVPFDDTPAHFAELERQTRQYMGDDPAAALEEFYAGTVRRFAREERVTIHRMKTFDAVHQFEDGSLDMVYVDANHQYEYVLRELLEYAPKLRPGGVFILNDHYDSPDGRMQNLGVVGAAATFLKRSEFVPVAMSAAAWSDLVITNDPGEVYCREFIDTLLASPAAIVEVPGALVPNYQHVWVEQGGKVIRHMPSFG